MKRVRKDITKRLQKKKDIESKTKIWSDKEKEKEEVKKMRNERAKRAESLEAVTHTHTHTHTPLFRFTEELVDSLERERVLI